MSDDVENIAKALLDLTMDRTKPIPNHKITQAREVARLILEAVERGR